MNLTKEMVIKVGKMPGKIEEVVVGEGTAVKEVLSIAGLEAEGYEIRVNGETSSDTATLSDGDRVLLVKMIKGNMPVIKVGKMPGKIEEVAVEDGATVGNVLEIAELSSDGYEVRVNGETASMGSGVSEGDRVLLVKMIKGNK